MAVGLPTAVSEAQYKLTPHPPGAPPTFGRGSLTLCIKRAPPVVPVTLGQFIFIVSLCLFFLLSPGSFFFLSLPDFDPAIHLTTGTVP